MEDVELKTKDLKIVIVGDGGCGKTVLLFAYTKDGRKAFEDFYVPTVLESYTAEVVVSEKLAVNLEIFDTAGQEDFENIRQMVYPDSHVFMMCYSCDSKATLANIKKFWYPETAKVCPKVPVVLVGNKLDLKDVEPDNYVTEEQARSMADLIGAKDSVQCSGRNEALGLESGKVERAFKLSIKYGLEYLANKKEKKPFCCTF